MIKETPAFTLDFNKLAKIAKSGVSVLPVIVQDQKTQQITMLGYVNQIALDYSLKHKVVAFWSTSRNELWIKGQTSGNYLKLKEVRFNCENNSLLFLVELKGKGACHTLNAQGNHRLSCYYRRLNFDGTISLLEK